MLRVQTNAYLYQYPSIVSHRNTLVAAGDEIRVYARSRGSIWVEVLTGDQLSTGQVTDSGSYGWVFASDLDWSTHDVLSLPTKEVMPIIDSNLSDDEAFLWRVPVLPDRLNRATLNLYSQAMTNGRDPSGFTKMGDSLTYIPQFLFFFGDPRADMGLYSSLDETRRYFARPSDPEYQLSVSAQKGLNMASLYDPFWASAARCQSGESPFTCEIENTNPSIVFIMFGPNDVRRSTAEEYRTNLTGIVDDLISMHIVPVLSTFPNDENYNFYEKSTEFNRIIVELASERNIPVINLWRASRDMPVYGLGGDGVHLRTTGYEYVRYGDGEEIRSGIAMFNLLSLQLLRMFYTASPG